jgi:hypoxanthine phosphoribosyltransferase
MQRQFLTLTWDHFDEAVAELAGIIDPGQAAGIYGEPRGGLPLAVALSHRTGLPLLLEPCAGMVWVDDIVDHGNTLQASRSRFPACQFLAWISRGQHSGVRVARVVEGGEWVIFPWECPDKAAGESNTYALSRLRDA